MLAHHNKSKGFMAILPAIIISAVLLIISLKANIVLVDALGQLDSRDDSLQAGNVVEACVDDIRYQIEQGSVPANETSDPMGTYSCAVSVTSDAVSYTVTATSQIFNTKRGLQETISKTDFSILSKKFL